MTRLYWYLCAGGPFDGRYFAPSTDVPDGGMVSLKDHPNGFYRREVDVLVWEEL